MSLEKQRGKRANTSEDAKFQVSYSDVFISSSGKKHRKGDDKSDSGILRHMSNLSVYFSYYTDVPRYSSQSVIHSFISYLFIHHIQDFRLWSHVLEINGEQLKVLTLSAPDQFSKYWRSLSLL